MLLRLASSPNGFIGFVVAATLHLLLGHLAFAAEPPVKEGLILHLDAAAQPALRQQHSIPPTGNLRPLERWLDASGGGLVALQPTPKSRPIFRAGDADAFVRFDGKDDFLGIVGPRRLTPAVTVFILAAPRANAGQFSALFATAETSQNDFTSGLNLDLGPRPTKELSVLNLESAGSTGFRDFLEPAKNLAAELPFEGFHVFTVRSRIGEKGNELFLDGLRLGERTRLESNIGLDEMIIGGRLCSNDPAQPPYAQGFFNGDIAAVLVYSRALDDAEREKVEQALFTRTAALNALASGAKGHALEVLSDPPTVQMLVPGFTVHELPVKLTNLTNLRYRHDGKLVALGYDGRIHLLTDSDGDGLEETARIFWDKSPLRGPIGIALLPKDDPRGDGVYVASKGKVSLILDKDRDGQADEEIVVATGWKENFTNVDATGLAVNPRDGSIYFCLGVENFANPYLVDAATGKAKFSLSTERSTIQRVTADFSKRETVSTGVRFACALAFNRDGDLFATEQEGATWLPNGNPFDELLHIVPGRHYGFPPRHPKHLPDVIDEPAVMEYGPQHQSTVGMVFNEGVNGGPAFGPEHWHGDALICGESRGKLYRTKLVKTAEGYVAQNHLIACLRLLTVDACLSPHGDLLVACHSGPPDWGTGPAGAGRIFRVRYAAPKVPQPVLAWASGPDEFSIAFDRPLNPAEWVNAREKVRVEAGRYVSAGDRFETMRPGYQVVRDQMAAPRRWVDVQSLSFTPDHQTMLLRVPVQAEPVAYAITLPAPESWRVAGGLPQQPAVDVALSLNGIQVTVGQENASARVVLPHPSFDVARQFTLGSAPHAEFFRKAAGIASSSGGLHLQGRVDVSNIFVPATQPGSTLDWDIAKDKFANRTMELRQGFSPAAPPKVNLDQKGAGSMRDLSLSLKDTLTLNTSGLTFALDQQVRPVPLHRLFVPWAGGNSGKAEEGKYQPRQDVAGNWLNGRRLYFGAAGCAACHTIRNEGMTFGPDLTNLVHRDRESVLRDIVNPSAAINPEQAGSFVKFIDGTEMSGIVRTLTDDQIVLLLPGGVESARPRAEVETIQPLKVSLMPEGLGHTLSKDQLEDLLTFLLTTPLEPAPISRLTPPAPPARSRAEVVEFLPIQAPRPEPLRVLLSAGEKDHGVDEHDYPLWLERWSRLLALAENVTVTSCMGFPSREQLGAADVTVFYSKNAGWSPEAATMLDEYQKKGGGLVYLHWAVEGGSHADALAERIGLATFMSRFRHGPLDLVFTNRTHPITRGFDRLSLVDESYWKMRGDTRRITTLAHSIEEQSPQPQLWTLEREKGRVFGCIPGHYTWTFDDPLYRVLVLRGIAWAAKQKDVDRLTELAVVGARIAP